MIQEEGPPFISTTILKRHTVSSIVVTYFTYLASGVNQYLTLYDKIIFSNYYILISNNHYLLYFFFSVETHN